MKNIEDFYNATAEKWAESGYSEEAEMPCLTDFVKEQAKGSRFLDLCCGCGYESARIQALGYDVVGIDLSDVSINIAKEKNPDIEFYKDDILSDYSYIGKVDAIIVIAGLVHIETCQLRQAFLRMKDVIKEGGYLFITIGEGTGKLVDKSITVIDGEEYDRNFIGHTLDELITASTGLFEFEREVGYDGTLWHNYIFKCK